MSIKFIITREVLVNRNAVTSFTRYLMLTKGVYTLMRFPTCQVGDTFSWCLMLKEIKNDFIL